MSHITFLMSFHIMSKISNQTSKIDLNNWTYYFKSKSISPINFIGFKAPLHLCRDIYDGNIELSKAEKDQGQFKLDLNEITRGNPKKKPAVQIKTIENIKNLDKSRQKVADLFNDSAKIRSKAKHETKHGAGILTLKWILQILPIALAQVKAVNSSESLLNEIRHTVYSLYQSKKLLKKYTIT